MEIAGPALSMMSTDAKDRHPCDIARQPRRDIAVVVELDRGDLASADDLGSVVLGYPDIGRVHTCLLSYNFTAVAYYIPMHR